MLEQVVAEALRQQPCFVTFSGGRDSSAILAVALEVARGEGLPEPVPVTLRFPGIESTYEDRWQEEIASHLKPDDWVRIDLSTEMDFLGSLARRGLSDHGLLWPANSHFMTAAFDLARGGTVLTGLDGDGLFGGWRWHDVHAVLNRHRAPVPRDVLRLAVAFGPKQVRAWRVARRIGAPPWLTGEGRRRFLTDARFRRRQEPVAWDAWLQYYRSLRFLAAGRRSLALLAADRGVRVVHPFMDDRFIVALANSGGRSGLGNREQLMQRLFGDALPSRLLNRRSKAEFGRAMWGPEVRAFAAQWNGEGIDDELVDPSLVRAQLDTENPPIAMATLMQMAWLEVELGPRS